MLSKILLALPLSLGLISPYETISLETDTIAKLPITTLKIARLAHSGTKDKLEKLQVIPLITFKPMKIPKLK